MGSQPASFSMQVRSRIYVSKEVRGKNNARTQNS